MNLKDGKIEDIDLLFLLYECGDAAIGIMQQYVKEIAMHDYPMSIYLLYCIGKVISRMGKLEKLSISKGQLCKKKLDVFLFSMQCAEVRP